MSELSPFAALVAHRVDDVDRWKVGFDGHEPARRAAGVLGHHINRSEDDPHLITIFLALSDIDKARAFAASDDLADIMNRLGVQAESFDTLRAFLVDPELRSS